MLQRTGWGAVLPSHNDAVRSCSSPVRILAAATLNGYSNKQCDQENGCQSDHSLASPEPCQRERQERIKSNRAVRAISRLQLGLQTKLVQIACIDRQLDGLRSIGEGIQCRRCSNHTDRDPAASRSLAAPFPGTRLPERRQPGSRSSHRSGVTQTASID